jgi:N utilization substance protein A
MENLALIDSFSEFKDDKLIDRVTLMAIWKMYLEMH